ncbi:septation protein A [Candidatus Methylomicrobium oryzae]|jgi:intracellular septation protein|uniref:septation protein A n=1 Tax=Candidatus Methylomicrobium oryzae TaxID=2802053 RepID=UPI0019223BF9|nr:septation protein A [Methylomicrobium sp. RS1]MBL1264406.1 septation protein A [Methylomicrobium sp. RS1]
MNPILEFFPIVLFFIAYKFYDIYVATGVVIVATILQVAYSWFKTRKVSTMQLITLGLILVMGGATIILQNEQFIKWKLSIVEWLFGLVFLGSQFIGKKPVIERMLSANLTLPDAVWRRLNTLWAFFFLGIGFVNVYVMYHYSTDDWVIFKTFVVPGLMVVFLLGQVALIYKHLPETEE